MVVYLLIGGAIFQVFEKPYQLMKNEEYRHTIQLFRKRYNVSERDMNILEQRILQDGKYFLSVDWSFSEAFFFAGTTVLTVGKLRAEFLVYFFLSSHFAGFKVEVVLIQFILSIDRWQACCSANFMHSFTNLIDQF